jgi:ethanolamine utilization cobalamin adenosyltransferase
VEAFADGTRPDLIEALNRMSSAVYLIFLRELSQ